MHVGVNRSVVGRIAKGIVESSDLHSFCCFLGKEVEKKPCYGVVAKIEILKVYETLGISHCFKHVNELVVT